MPKYKKPHLPYRESYTSNCVYCNASYFNKDPKQRYCSESCKETHAAKLKESMSGLPGYMVSREIIFRRDEYKCIYCGKSSIEDGVKLHLEHVYPLSRGGDGDLYNLATSCERCNAVKNSTILNEEIILRIWERNERLNNKGSVKSYKDLSAVFLNNAINRAKT